MQFLGLRHVALAGVDNEDTYLLRIKETIFYMEWEFSLHLTCLGTGFVCTLNERKDVLMDNPFRCCRYWIPYIL